MLIRMHKNFYKFFGQRAQRAYLSPGAVNLIGEHVDYNGGRVLPCAISSGSYALVAKNESKELRLFSLNFPKDGVRSFPINNLCDAHSDDWTDYPKAVFSLFRKKCPSLNQGYDILLYSTLAGGMGLSSTASIGVLMAYILVDYQHMRLSRLDMALLSQQVQADLLSAHNGIMDQFVIANGCEGKALLVHCENLTYDTIPFELGDYHLLIMHSGKDEPLANTQYQERRSECQQVLAILQESYPIKNLCELPLNELEEKKRKIKDPLLYKRATHVISEHERVMKAVNALHYHDMKALGLLMNASHDSLRDNYHMSTPTLDFLVSCAREQKGVLGARMIGTGMLGCAIALVHKDHVDQFRNAVGQRHEESLGMPLDFYVEKAARGVHRFAGDMAFAMNPQA